MKKENKERKLLEEVMSHSDPNTQAAILIEEMAELTFVVIKHFFRNVDSFEKILEEVADVEIMLAQMKLILVNHSSGYTSETIEQHLKTQKRFKLQRLQERLNRLESSGSRQFPQS